jgi:hypothetical protein
MTVDTAQIRDRAIMATTGEWEVDEESSCVRVKRSQEKLFWFADGDNARFIAAARTDIPALCDTVDALRKRVAQLEQSNDLKIKLHTAQVGIIHDQRDRIA